MTIRPRIHAYPSAFTLVEALIATAVVSIFFVALYTGIAQGFGIMSNAREDLRANQILVDKMEEMKLYRWDQITSFGTPASFIPTNFTEAYYPDDTSQQGAQTTTSGPESTNNTPGNFRYYGSVLITNVTFTNTTYTNSMREVRISVSWTNGAKAHRHEMTTYVSEYGMQKYIY